MFPGHCPVHSWFLFLPFQLPHFTAAMDGLLRTSHPPPSARKVRTAARDRKSTRLNSSHVAISYAVFCLKKKKKKSTLKPTMEPLNHTSLSSPKQPRPSRHRRF